MYKISPFLIHELNESESIVQTNSSTVFINNTELIGILKCIEEDNVEELTEQWINKKVNKLRSDEVITFLLNNKIIEEKKLVNCFIDRIICCTNNNKFEDLFNITFNKKYKILFVSPEKIYEFIFKSTDCCLVFFEPFIYRDFLSIDKYLKKVDVMTKFVFYYNYSFYFSNFYKYEWHSPCPKCFFSNLENHLRGSQLSDKMNFQLLIDLIYQKKIDFPISANIECYDLITVMYILKHQFAAFFARESYIVNEITELSLHDDKIIKDNSVYWEMCDCYE